MKNPPKKSTTSYLHYESSILFINSNSGHISSNLTLICNLSIGIAYCKGNCQILHDIHYVKNIFDNRNP